MIETNKDPEVEFFKGRLDVEEILEALAVDMAFRDRNHIMCHCPDLMGNHKNGDANPSFGFDEEELLYNCFVCGGGTIIRLTQDMLGMERDEAIDWLISMSDLEPAEDERFKEQIEKKLAPIRELEPDPEYPLDALFPFRKIHPYLYERGLTKDVIIEHQVGFDESHYGIVIPHLFMGKLKGWQVRHLVSKEIDDRTLYYCPVCAPYHDPDKIPKYKNTSHFPKENSLYGYDHAMAWCKENQRGDIIVVESPFTALYLKSHGFPNVVATFGAFSRAQATLLFPFSRVYFWPDNDKAGVENTKRAIEEIEMDTALYIVPVVPGEKSDAANLPYDDIQGYLEQSIPSILWGQHAIS